MASINYEFLINKTLSGDFVISKLEPISISKLSAPAPGSPPLDVEPDILLDCPRPPLVKMNLSSLEGLRGI